jgi:hypothetical protein
MCLVVVAAPGNVNGSTPSAFNPPTDSSVLGSNKWIPSMRARCTCTQLDASIFFECCKRYQHQLTPFKWGTTVVLLFCESLLSVLVQPLLACWGQGQPGSVSRSYDSVQILVQATLSKSGNPRPYGRAQGKVILAGDSVDQMLQRISTRVPDSFLGAANENGLARCVFTVPANFGAQ